MLPWAKSNPPATTKTTARTGHARAGHGAGRGLQAAGQAGDLERAQGPGRRQMGPPRTCAAALQGRVRLSLWASGHRCMARTGPQRPTPLPKPTARSSKGGTNRARAYPCWPRRSKGAAQGCWVSRRTAPPLTRWCPPSTSGRAEAAQAPLSPSGRPAKPLSGHARGPGQIMTMIGPKVVQGYSRALPKLLDVLARHLQLAQET